MDYHQAFNTFPFVKILGPRPMYAGKGTGEWGIGNGELVVTHKTGLKSRYALVRCVGAQTNRMVSFINRWLNDPLVPTFERMDVFPNPCL